MGWFWQWCNGLADLGLLILAALALGGCASPTTRPAEPLLSQLDVPGETGECARFFVALDRVVHEAGVADAEAARIPGFPYLRVNRFLAYGAKPEPETRRFDAWAVRLQVLDRQARAAEIANLPPGAARKVLRLVPEKKTLTEVVAHCGELLLHTDLADGAQTRLAEIAKVPDSYSLRQRVFGLYPVSSLFFLAGVARLHSHIHREFERPLDRLEVRGELIRLYPPTAAGHLGPAEVASIVERSSRNPLQIPEPKGPDRGRLFATFAPVWEVDVVSDDDRIGTPFWADGPYPAVDVDRPAVFRRISHTRFHGEILLQLNYIVWFPSRPRAGPFDLLGGRLDGIIWRVTLGNDGRPLVYDAVHNCGCYHMFFPTERLRLRHTERGHEEPPLVPQTVSADLGRTVIRVAHGTHYIQRVYTTEQYRPGTRYAMRDYRELRSLPLKGASPMLQRRRSLFRSDGLVPGTERRERWVYWPMGISEPGAMRQWGHHATAFVGRRHFDDPDLIERYFVLVSEPVKFQKGTSQSAPQPENSLK